MHSTNEMGPFRRRIALLHALQRAAGRPEVADRLAALAMLLIWAELAAAGGRNDHRPAWMRTGPATRRPGLRLARRSIAGRRARG
jgi:hypothetical protein